MRVNKFGLLLAVVMAIFFASLPLAAQERFGTITGRVADPSGLATPGVTVTVTNKETQRSTVVVTDGNGMFIARGLDPGRYSVKFELSGFTGTSHALLATDVGSFLKSYSTFASTCARGN